MSESAALREVILAVSEDPDVFGWRQNTGAAIDRVAGRFVRFGVPGCADVLCVVGPYGRFLALETKARHGRQSIAQKRFQAAVERVNGLYRIVHSGSEATAAVAEARRCI